MRAREWSFGSSAIAAPTRYRGVTLAELLVVIGIVGILFCLAAVRVRSAADAAATRAASSEAVTAFARARQAAMSRGSAAAVHIDSARGTIEVHAESVVVLARDLHALYGVALAATRDSMAYDPRGLGVGAANLSLVLRRGRAADTLFVSRLGRVRH